MRRNFALLGVLSIALAALLLARVFTPGDKALGTGTSIFGDGSDGAKAYSASTTDAPIDATAGGLQGQTVLGAFNPSFAAGQSILIYQSRGTGVGDWELNRITAYQAGEITLAIPLAHTYVHSSDTNDPNKAQVLVVPEYTSLDVNPGVIVTTKQWNGLTGGIFAAFVSGTATVDGTITGMGRGYARGEGANIVHFVGWRGEGTAGASNPGAESPLPNGNGGGGGNGPCTFDGSGGGGGGNAAAGDNGAGPCNSQGGLAAGLPDLSVAVFGGGGGGGEGSSGTFPGGDGGNGGGMIFVAAKRFQMGGSGLVTVNGIDGNATQPPGTIYGGGGAGAGGSLFIRSESASLGPSLVTAQGGIRGLGSTYIGGAGADGRIRVEYCVSASGSTDPVASFQQISCKPQPALLSITKLSQIAPPKSCYNVLTSSQTQLFQVCDNDWLGAPASNAVCVPDGVCNDEDTAQGQIKVSISPGDYHVVESVAPPNHSIDTSKHDCDASSGTCAVTVIDAPNSRPWFPWDIVGIDGPCGGVDGKVTVADILAVVQHFGSQKPFPGTATPVNQATPTPGPVC